MPTVTCVVPSYNRPKLIKDTIDSLREQTLKDIEVLICDDDSNLETIAAIEDAFQGDERFRLIRQAAGRPALSERGQLTRYCMTINRGLSEATGLYQCSIPDDDFYFTTWFEEASKALDAHPQVPVVYGRMRSVTYDASSHWDSSAAPKAGRTYAKWGETDPETGKPVNPATWEPGMRQLPGGLDHSQFMWRASLLKQFPTTEWWPVCRADQDVGDAAFLKCLAALGHQALAVDTMACSKRFHGLSYGRTKGEARE